MQFSRHLSFENGASTQAAACGPRVSSKTRAPRFSRTARLLPEPRPHAAVSFELHGRCSSWYPIPTVVFEGRAHVSHLLSPGGGGAHVRSVSQVFNSSASFRGCVVREEGRAAVLASRSVLAVVVVMHPPGGRRPSQIENPKLNLKPLVGGGPSPHLAWDGGFLPEQSAVQYGRTNAQEKLLSRPRV